MNKTLKFSLLASLGLLSMAATIKISDMVAATTVGNADLFTLVQGGVNKKVTQSTLLTNIFANVTAGNNVTVTNQGTNIIIAASSSGSSWPPTNYGVVIQEKHFPFQIKTNTTLTIPSDDTIPQISEGLALITNSITPLSTNSYLVAEFYGQFSAGGAISPSAALFFNGQAASVGASKVTIGGADFFYTMVTCSSNIANSSLTAKTFSYNMGNAGSGTVYINRGNTGTLTNVFAQTTVSKMVIREIQGPLP